MVQFYISERINDRITAVRSLTGEIMYLIEGEDRAVLVDTCLGVGHLRGFVEKLTDKPLTVILTHGHIDHAMGAPEFERVYMNSADRVVYEEMSDIEDRKGYIAANNGGELPDFAPEDYVSPFPVTFHELNDGDVFDLGGLHLDIYALPGHTRGSMIVLVREERILILGDACNTATFLFDRNSLTVEEYQEHLIAVDRKLEGTYERVFLCHHDMETSPDIIRQVIQVCDDIIQERADDVPFEFMGQTYYMAKTAGDQMKRADGGCGNIIYNKEKIKRTDHN